MFYFNKNRIFSINFELLKNPRPGSGFKSKFFWIFLHLFFLDSKKPESEFFQTHSDPGSADPEF